MDRPGTSRYPLPLIRYHVCPPRACITHPQAFLHRASSWSAPSLIAAPIRPVSGAAARSRTNRSATSACSRLQRTPPDRVCGASGCGKGVSVVNEWCHSQRDKDNKDLWFCRPCYDKEVRIPRFPQLHHEVTSRIHHEVTSRTVSLTSRRSIFLFFAVGATHGRSGEDVRELPVYQDMQVAHLRRRTRWQDLPPMPLQRRKPERVPEGVPQDENAEESLSVDDPNPLFPFFDAP